MDLSSFTGIAGSKGNHVFRALNNCQVMKWFYVFLRSLGNTPPATRGQSQLLAVSYLNPSTWEVASASLPSGSGSATAHSDG